MKDVEAGTKTNHRFRTDDRVEQALVDLCQMESRDQDGGKHAFMARKLRADLARRRFSRSMERG
jgi:elongation factor P